MNKMYINLLLMLCVMVSLPIFASNYSFLSDAPVSYFTTEDSKILLAAQMDALNHYHDGTKVTWNNPKTGAHGTIIPSDSTKMNNLHCRKLTMNSFAQNRTGKATFTYCKVDNVWKIKS